MSHSHTPKPLRERARQPSATSWRASPGWPCWNPPTAHAPRPTSPPTGSAWWKACSGAGQLRRITQQALAYLVGLSRQHVHKAQQTLQAAGLIRIEYGGLRVLELQGLRPPAVG